MSVRSSIERLHADVAALGEALERLNRRALDNPPDNVLPLAQTLGDAGDAMAGWAAEAREAARRRRRDRAGGAALAIQRRMFRVRAELDEWTGYERTADLIAAGQEGGRRGHDWSLELRDALEACRAALTAVEHRLLACWEELVETGLAGGVSVKAVSVGQQVSVGGEAPPKVVDLMRTGGEAGADRS